MPAPAEWVNVRRIRVKDSVEYIFWLSASAFPKADNSKVLQAYSRDMERLIKRGVKQTKRPSGHNIKPTFSQDRGGSIPANIITCGNNESNSNYIRQSKELGQKVHPARFPAELPRFFIEFLTEPGDVVLDPFARSNTTGRLRNNWGGAGWPSKRMRPTQRIRNFVSRFRSRTARPTDRRCCLRRWIESGRLVEDPLDWLVFAG